MFNQEQVSSFTNSVYSRISADTSRVTTASDIANERNLGLVKEYSQGDSISVDYRPMDNTSAGSSFVVGSDSLIEQQSGNLYIPPESSFATDADDQSETNPIFDRSQSNAGVEQLIPGSILVNDRGEIYESATVNRTPIRSHIISSEKFNENQSHSSIYLSPTDTQQNQAITNANQQGSKSSSLSVDSQETHVKGNITNIESNASLPLINTGYDNKHQGLSPLSDNSVGNATVSIVSGSLATSLPPSASSTVSNTSVALKNLEDSSVKSQFTNAAVQSNHSTVSPTQIQSLALTTNTHIEIESATSSNPQTSVGSKPDTTANKNEDNEVEKQDNSKNNSSSKIQTPTSNLTENQVNANNATVFHPIEKGSIISSRARTTSTSTKSTSGTKSSSSISNSSTSSEIPNTPQNVSAKESILQNNQARTSTKNSSSSSSKHSSKENTKLRRMNSTTSIASKNTRSNSRLDRNKTPNQTPVNFDVVLSRLSKDNSFHPILLRGAYDTVLREGEVLTFLPTPAYYHRVFPLDPRPIVSNREDSTNEDARKNTNTKLIESNGRSNQSSPKLDNNRQASQPSASPSSATKPKHVEDERRSSSSQGPLKLTQFDLNTINDALDLASKHPERFKIVDSVSPTLREPSLKSKKNTRPPSVKEAVPDLQFVAGNRPQNLPETSLASVPKRSEPPVVPPASGLFASLFGGAGAASNSSAQVSVPTTDTKPLGLNNDFNNVTYYTARALPNEPLNMGSFIPPCDSSQINPTSLPSKSNVRDPLESIANKNGTMLRTNQNPFESTPGSHYESNEKRNNGDIHYIRRRRYTAPLNDYERLINLLIRKTSITLI